MHQGVHYRLVYKVYDYITCETFAIKYIAKDPFDPLDWGEDEGDALKLLQHPCILKMLDIYDGIDCVCIRLELMAGGDSNVRISDQGFLPESVAKLLFYQMCHAVKYIHGKQMVHRDLKPANIWLTSASDDNALIKIGDFGLAKLVGENAYLRTFCGTPR